MHSLLSLTLTHNRFLSRSTAPLSVEETFHQYHSVALLKCKLTSPIDESELDPLWAASMILGIVNAYHVEGTCPAGVWPLKTESSSDLSWLKIINGRNQIQHLLNTSTNDSMFNTSYHEAVKSFMPSSSCTQLQDLPVDFVSLYHLDCPEIRTQNPCYTVAVAVARVLYLDSMFPVLMGFLEFVANMSNDYAQLLKQKEPRALLVLAYWHAKTSQFQLWWLSRRAVLEGKAICIHLRKHHGDFMEIQNLLACLETALVA